MNGFDKLKKAMWGSVNGIMAVPVSWVSQNDPDVKYTGKALFNSPNVKDLADGSGFIPSQPFIEFDSSNTFIGLKLIVDKKTTDEVINVDGVAYYVRAVDNNYDGGNAKAYLEQVNDPYGPQNQ